MIDVKTGVAIGAVALTLFSAVVLSAEQKRQFTQPFRSVLGLIMASVGFMRNCSVDIKQNKEQLQENVELLYSYLKQSAIDKELKDALNQRFLLNAALLMHSRSLLPSRKDEVALLPSQPKKLDASAIAQRYARYSSAVYGREMMGSIEIEILECQRRRFQTFVDQHKRFPKPCDSLHSLVAAFVGSISPSDILHSDMNFGESSDYLRHMLVVDHSQQSIVLAIRGTYSLSGTIVDLIAFSKPFCGGQAHAGMADMAMGTWNHVKNHVQAAMEEYPEYSLVLTGHSLGASVVCLVTILLYHENAFPNQLIESFAYAPAPVFYPLHLAPSKAIENTTVYVNQYDVVPSLSMYAVRHLMQTILQLDLFSKDLPITERLKLIKGKARLPKLIIDVIEKARMDMLKDKEGSPMLIIPARCILWLEQQEDESYLTRPLCPIKFSKRLIDIDSGMLDQHMMSKYCVALNNIKH